VILRRAFFKVLLVLALCHALPVALSAQTAPQLTSLVRLLESRYRNVKTLKAAFLQTYRDGRSGIQVESGTVYFSSPGRMRWEYESPETKLFVADGKSVWLFVPADRTVTRSPMKESDDWRTPLSLLTGKAKLSQLCERINLASAQEGQSGHAVLNCIPRGTKLPKSSTSGDLSPEDIFSPAPYDRVLLEVDRSSGELADVRILQQGGVELEFRFGQWQQGVAVDQSLFRFQLPPGVAILDGSTLR
jgi:outer membrane lipoprotein carrier protein